MDTREQWLRMIGTPENYSFIPSLRYIKTYHLQELDVETYIQANGPNTTQRLWIALPKEIKEPLPAVAVPFYFPEAMLQFDPETGETLPRYQGIAMLRHLAARGFIAASADAYHLTYLKSERARDDFGRWHDAARALNREHPEWTGIGKLMADTRLLIDALVSDPRVDGERIGIAGHSLGGKMAFYAGCLDERVRVILASDFGIRWEQTNWEDPWYWGSKLDILKAAGMDHGSLLSCAAPKPFCLIAGQYDNAESYAMMLQAGYTEDPERLRIINHASGHRPPADALNEGYAFLERWLKMPEYNRKG